MAFVNKSFSDFAYSICLKQIIDKLDLNQKYWKGKTWIETIDLRRNNPIKNFNDKTQIDKVLHWGGIYGFKDHENVNAAFSNLQNNKISEPTLDRISSYSKLFSFYNSDKFFILDARVAFSLNCLLISCNDSDDNSKHRVPELIDFKFKTKSRNAFIKEKSDVFELFPKFRKIPYQEYNDLIIELYNDPFCQGALRRTKLKGLERPEIIEMILFKYYEDIFYKCRVEKRRKMAIRK
jgi:hypothetical protein